MRGRLLKQSTQYELRHTFRIRHHIVVPDSHYAIPTISEPLIPNDVPLATCMLTSIQFHDQSAITADEIDNVGTDRLLAHELEAA